MARFDVYPGYRQPGFLLDCQSDTLDLLESRVVVPLLPVSSKGMTDRLHPMFDVRQQKVIMATHLIFAIPVERMAKPVASLADEHLTIMNALDMLLTGY